jgi:A/G-specific adenine glycosylase
MSFAQQLIVWQRRHGRHDLPWQRTRDPYRIWLAEIMLQQTQVSAVIPYYQRFLIKFPNVEALAAASEDEVLRLWSGLGYYARGRNLHKAAREISSSGFPRTSAEIQTLPGIGRTTAAAIAVFAFGERAAILDGNVKRVLARCFGEKKDLWPLAERLLPKENVEAYTQALMDLGATVCTRKPRCEACPTASNCLARKTGRIAELPAPRVRKPLPLKRTTWFVYRHAGKVLLERRASPGIWGGWWCFPEKAVLKAGASRRLPQIDHGFTHFRLRIRPLLHDLTRAARTPGRLWFDVEEALGAAVPSPVRKLLSGFVVRRFRETATSAGAVRR